jgi:hypothetical protein
MKHGVAASMMLALIITLSACGGGGGGITSGGPTNPPPPAVTLTLLPTTLPNATQGDPYDFRDFAVNGNGVQPYTFSLSGALPPGLSLTSVMSPNTAIISGTPTTVGTFNFTVNVADAGGLHTGSRPYTLVVDQAFRIVTQQMPTAKIGTPYDQPIEVINGQAPFNWSIATGQLPAGLALDPATGHIHGTPTLSITLNFEVQVTDASSPAQTAHRTITITAQPPLTFVGSTTAFLSRGIPGTVFVSTTGGVGNITVQPIAGTVPPGLSFQGNIFVGTPTQLGTFVVTMQAQDSYIGGPEIITRDYTITVRERPPVIVTTLVPAGIVGSPYDFTLAADGGQPPYTWGPLSVPGLTFDVNSGHFTGTPTTAGDFGLALSLQDSSNPPQSAFIGLTLPINAVALGRNDSIATATPVGNVSFRASLSPFVNGSGIAAPDTDYYVATADGGATVSISVSAVALSGPTSIDPVLEIVNAAGQRLTTCRNQGSDDGVTGAIDSTPIAFDDVCLIDDNILGVDLNANLGLLIPPGMPQTFYIHVSNYPGDARPDLTYNLAVSGVN